jgi:two-component system copper resistance phosphate regulon response regulator CusR
MRLLLVEDEEKTSTYLSRALGESGFTVDISADGAEGLHYALEFDYDAIILDVMLPGMDGYRVLEGTSRQTDAGADALCTGIGRRTGQRTSPWR